MGRTLLSWNPPNLVCTWPMPALVSSLRLLQLFYGFVQLLALALLQSEVTPVAFALINPTRICAFGGFVFIDQPNHCREPSSELPTNCAPADQLMTARFPGNQLCLRDLFPPLGVEPFLIYS